MVCQPPRLVRRKPHCRIDVLLVDKLRRLMLDLFNLHPARLRTLMTFRGELTGSEKGFWTVALFCFLLIEIKAIDKDRVANDEKQREVIAAEQLNFKQVTNQASQNFAQTTSELTTAITGLGSVLGTTQDVAKLARDASGGNSYAYIAPGSTENEGPYVMSVFNAGSQTLMGV